MDDEQHNDDEQDKMWLITMMRRMRCDDNDADHVQGNGYEMNMILMKRMM
jgi:hypothetical protein